MNMGKKGQITLYIIIFLVIILVIGGTVFYFTNQVKAKNDRAVKDAISASAAGDSDYSVVNLFVQECLEMSAINGVFDLGNQGGYFTLPKETITTEKGEVPFFYRPGKQMSPNKRKIITEFQDYIKYNTVKCADFSVLKKRGINVKGKEPEVVVKLLEDEAVIELSYPLTVTKDSKTQTLDKWTYTLPFDYGYVYYMYDDLVSTIAKNPKYKDLTQLVSYKDYEVMIMPINKTTDIYLLSTYRHGIDERKERYNFMFAVER
jgi:uncharacterized protein (UPF0333 family)